MGFDSFVRIDQIEGESTDAKYHGWIEIVDYKTWLMQNILSSPSSAGGACAGRADFGSFSFVKFMDKTSPKLSLFCAAGKHIKNIDIEVCRAGGDKVKFLEYKLTNCIISAVLSSGGQGEFPSEMVKIDYGKIQWVYIQQKRDSGGPSGQIACGWDRQRNCKV